MSDEVLHHLLVVDDDPDIINQIKVALDYPSIRIDSAGNANEAMRRYEELKPKLILLDIGLPGTSGFVALRRIRQKSEELYHKVLIIMLTGKTSREDVTTAMAYGADDYLAKPFDRNGLTTKLQKHLGALK